MHKARFIGKRMAKRWTNGRGWHDNLNYQPYFFWQPQHPDVWEDINLLYEGPLDEPILTKGQMIYIHTIGKSAEIEGVFRSTDGTYTYQTSYVIEQIEDEDTIRSKEEAEAFHKSYCEKYEPEVRSDPPHKKKSWWQRLFR